MRFQSTPPHARGDLGVTPEYVSMVLFQSTPPMRGATPRRQVRQGNHLISIHAPRVGGDLVAADAIHISVPISIHAPRVGGRHYKVSADYILGIFQSTPPMRGATSSLGSSSVPTRFQSTPPVRGATRHLRKARPAGHISIHAPVRGATAKAHKFLCRFCSKQRMFPDSSCFKAIIQDMTSENNSAAREN